MSEPIREPIEKYGLSKRNQKKTLFSRIGVVGCGKDGSVIATAAASHGMEVIFLEPSEERIANAYARIETKLDRQIKGWGLTENEKNPFIHSEWSGITCIPRQCGYSPSFYCWLLSGWQRRNPCGSAGFRPTATRFQIPGRWNVSTNVCRRHATPYESGTVSMPSRREPARAWHYWREPWMSNSPERPICAGCGASKRHWPLPI